MQVTKNQHYVPRFYLKNFSENKKSIGMFRRTNNRLIENASIRQVAYRDYLYGKDGEIEKWLSRCERKWSRAVNWLLDKDTTVFENPLEYNFLFLHFIQISLARTAKVADGYHEAIDFLGKLLDEAELAGGNLAITREEVYKDYGQPNKVSLEVANELVAVLADLKPLTIINETTRGFITSDNPVAIYNLLYAERKYHINYGLGTAGIIIFLPLSEEVCFCLYDPAVYSVKSDDPANVSIKSINQINELNKLFATNAYESIFWGLKNKPDYIKRLGKYITFPRTYVREYPIMGSKDTIVRFGDDSIFKRFQLPFFRINNRYLNIELPNNMGGLQRKRAKEYAEQYNNSIGFRWGDGLKITE